MDRIFSRYGVPAIIGIAASALSAPEAVSEGTAQWEIGQDYLNSSTTNQNQNLYVDITNIGEVINISACGDANNDDIEIRMFDPSGAEVTFDGEATAGITLSRSNISCTDPLTGPITPPAPATADTVKFTTTGSSGLGAYRITIRNLNGGSRPQLNRVDVSVTDNATIAPDPTGASAGNHTGRLYSFHWRFDAGTFASSGATDADFYMLTPGGTVGTNYVWQLDLQGFAGFVYDIVGNSLGVDSPNGLGENVAGLSVPQDSNNSFTPEFPVYLNYPVIADPAPSTNPAVTGFTFTDDAGQDGAISPGGSVGVQDSGVFQFNTNVDGTYAISIDANQNGVFGDPGDVLLLGLASPGSNSVAWDGRDNSGNVLPVGQYQANLTVRLGEFHFIAADAETSGGPTGDGLTIYNATGPSSTQPTLVYWDDLTMFPTENGPQEATANTPDGGLSGTAAGYHNWGIFSTTGSNNFGDLKYIDTYVYGLATVESASAAIIDSDEPVSDATITITENSLPGDTLTIEVADADRNLNAGSQDTITVDVVNNATGETETVTLTETGNATGVFSGTIATTFGTSAGTNDDGTFNSQATNTITATYRDEFNSSEVAADISDTNTVGGGVTGSVTATPSGFPGDTVTVQVTDADLDTTPGAPDTVQVTVVNDDTGESELLTLTETGNSTGVFTATVSTVFGANAGTDNDGSINVDGGDTLTTTYNDALTTEGGSASPTATTTISAGSDAVISITDPSIPGDTITVQVTDADRDLNAGSPDTIQVTVGNDVTGESELLTLTETGNSTGVFSATVATTFGASAGTDNDGTFNTEAGDTLTATYNDIQNTSGSAADRTDTGNVNGGDTGSVTITDPSVPGDALTIQVSDSDLDATPGAPDTIQVTAINTVTGESELVTLTETGNSTGVFIGTVATTFGTGAGTDDDGTFNTEAGDTISVTYNDALTTEGSTATPSDTSTVNGGVTGTISMTAAGVPGDTITVQVTDADLDATPGAPDTVQVTVVNGDTGESELVTLTETGNSTGVFTGTVATTFGASAGTDNDGTFNASNGDTLTATYDDALTTEGDSAAPSATTAISGGTDAVISITDPSIPGDTITVQVTDADRDQNAGSPDTIQVTVVNDVTGESELLTLTETGNSTGVFSATVATTFGASAGTDNDGTFNTEAGDTLTATYNDVQNTSGSAADRTDTGNVNGGDTGAVTITDPSVPGDTLTIQVSDSDLDATPGAPDAIQVTAINTVTGESELVTLTETGNSTGVFTGTVATTFGTGAGTDNDGTFNTEAGDTISVTYNDALTTEGNTATPSDTSTVNGGDTGSVTITDPSIPGDTLTIQVSDSDLDATPGAPDTIQVTAINTVTGESELVTLTETGNSTGVFTGTVATTFGTGAGTDDDGTFNTEAGDTISVTYNDALTTEGDTATPSDTSTVNGGVTGTISMTAAGVPGDTITIQVTDADLDATPGAPDTVQVTVVNGDTGESELVTLTETGNATGVFTGTVATTFGASAGADNDGTFNASNGDTLTATYNDALTTEGGAANPTASSGIGGGATGAVSITSSSIPGDTLTVQVTDADLNTDAGTEQTVNVTVVNDITGESEVITLTETGPNTGIFEANLSSAFGTSAGTANDGVMNTQAGDTVTVTYADALTADGSPANPTDIGTVIGGETGSVTITDPSVPGDTLTIQVSDSDLDTTPGAPDTIQVTAFNTVTGESELVTLTETGNSTGVFAGTVATTFGTGAGTDDDGTFNTEAGDTISVTYNDALTTEGNAATPSDTSTVNGGVTGVVDINDGIAPGDTVQIELNDADLNSNPAVAETITVTVTNQMTGELETLSLTETGPNTGVFTGSLNTAFGTSAGTYNDGTFNVARDDVLEVSYDDAFTANGGPSSTSDTTTVSNLPPVGGDDSAATEPGVSVSIPVFANDTDPEGQPLTITSVTQGANGSVSFLADGTVIYSPNAGFVGTDSFTYTIDDGFGGTDTVTVTVTVDEESPTANADSGATTPNNPVSIDVLNNDSDPNGDVLSVTISAQPANGTVNVNPDGSVTYTPATGFEGTDTFTYEACDPSGNCDTAIVTVNVSPDAPQAEDDAITTPGETQITFNPLVNDTDPNGDTLTISSVATPANGTLSINPDGTLTYVPNPGFIGIETFTYQVCDPSGNCDTASITITVENQAPIASDDSAATEPNTPVSIPALANDADPEGQDLTVMAVTQATNGTVSFDANGTLVYTPNPGFTGSDTFTYTVCDTHDDCDTASVSITVDAETPTAVADSGGTIPNTPVTIDVLENDSDPNGDTLSVSLVSAPTNGTVSVGADGSLTYTPNTGFTGADTFTYEICDPDGNCDTAIVTISVSENAPQANDDTVSTPGGEAVLISPLFNDSDPNGDTLSLGTVTDPANGTVTINPGGTLTYLPDTGFSGTDTFTYEICDPDGNCDTATITVTVENLPPVAEDDSLAAQPGDSVSIPVLANDTDPEGDPLTVTSVTQGANGTVTFDADGTVIYMPNEGFAGSDTFTYEVCDPDGQCDTATVSITIDEVSPTAVADSATTQPDDPVSLDLSANDTDPNGDALTYTLVDGPNVGVATIETDGTLNYTPPAGFVGTETLTYRACDQDGNCDTATVMIIVSDDIPQANDDLVDAAAGDPVTINPLANDEDPNGDPLTLTDVTSPANGMITVNPDGSLTYTPNDGFEGIETVTYTVCDNAGNCDTATITFDVRATANISGIVFLDTNSDDTYQPTETLLAGYIVELRVDGVVVATTVTDENGFYSFEGLEPEADCDIVFINPETGVAVGVIEGLSIVAGENVIDQNLPIDPSGIVYDIATGDPIVGAQLTILDGSGTPLPTVCLVDASQQNQVTGSDGFYGFDLVPGADAACPAAQSEYQIELTLPDGTRGIFGVPPLDGPLDASTCTIDALPGPTCEVSPSPQPPIGGGGVDFFTEFLIGPGDPDVINNHLPVDLNASAQPLVATKTATSATASTGGVVVYTITLQNDQDVDLAGLDIVDRVPAGFQYVDGSARLDGQAVEPVRVERDLVWSNVRMDAGEILTITLALVVGAGAEAGEYINVAYADNGAADIPLSNFAEAPVRVTPDDLFECAEVIGKVFEDKNENGIQDEGENGIAGVRLASVRGLLITTDEFGRYHITCAATPKAGIGSNFILKVDDRTLPSGYTVTTENPRVIRLTQGKMSQLDFGITLPILVELQITEDAFLAGSDELEPEWFERLNDLILALEEQRSYLKLVYIGAELADERLTALETEIETRWKDEARTYDLVIEKEKIAPS